MIGMDFGASFVDVVILKGRKLEAAYSIPQKRYSAAFLQGIIREAMRTRVAYTGGRAEKGEIAAVYKKSRKLKNLERKLRIAEISEIKAIAEGAKFLTGKRRFLVANVGTGTPFVHVNGKKFTHVAGTGVGGGTLEAFANVLLKEEVENLEKLARKGNDSLDLKVSDLIGGNLDGLPGDATASNFGKLLNAKKISKADLSLSLLKMIAEILGVMAVLAARSCKCKEVVFTGRVIEENKTIRERISAAFKLFGGKVIFPKNAKYCTAIGAAIAATG